jgi:hypothetical protein
MKSNPITIPFSFIKGRSACLTAGLALLMAAGAAGAQEFAPHIGYVYPAGGQQGTTFQVTFGGQFLVEPSAATVSGTGVQAVVLPSEPLLTGKQAADLRGKLKELRKQKGGAAIKEIRELSHKLAVYEKSKVTPATGERIAVRIIIARDAVPGNREVRLATATGLTNPLLFQVGQLPECREPDSGREDDWTRTQKTINDPDSRVKPGRNAAQPTAVTLPTTVNGQILPGEADRFRFQARKGQKLVVAVHARELLPYLADTVPGWLQATVSVSDPKGKELTAEDDVQIRPDPVLRYAIPEDGKYVMEIRDSLYRGREDFVYRIRIGELPGLPNDALPAALAARQSDAGGQLPESAEREPNDTPDSAQPVAPPIVITGRIDEPGDCDVYRFEGKAGDPVVAEVTARRLDSPLDSLLIITNADDKRIGFNDDHEDKGSGLNTHHADSYLAVTLPSTGVYFALIGDTQQKGGAAYGYRLRLSPPQPDFTLRITPSTLNIRANATQPLTVYALRRDGFSGAITLALKDAPPGFLLAGGNIPANQDKVQCTLTAPASAPQTPVRITLEGRAAIRGQPVVRSAVPAQELTQAFSYQHLVPSEDLLVQVTDKFAPDSPARLLSGTPVKIPMKGTAQALFSAPRYSSFDKDQIRLLDPPEGITIKGTASDKGRLEILLEADAAKVKPGLAGNLIAAFAAKDPTPPGAPKINPKRVPLGSLPAIPFEVVGEKNP